MADKKELSALDLIHNVFDQYRDPSREILERIWFRNILYYTGEQYIEWLRSTNTFRRKPVHPDIPTPTGDIIGDYVQSMTAMILNKEYTVRVWPNSNEQRDREASLLGADVLTHLDQANNEEFKDEKELVALWMVIAGTAFMRTFAQKDKGEWWVTKNGDFASEGDVTSENVIPFNVHVDPLGDRLNKKRWVGLKTLKPKEWVEDTFKVLVQSESSTRDIDYQKRLMRLVANVSPWKGAGIDSGAFDLETEDLVLFKELEFRPTPKYPNGRYIAAVGEEVLINAKKLPIPVKNSKWFYTLTDFHFHHVPGRFWSDGGVNRLISPQNSTNSILQALEMNRKGLGRPWVTAPVDIKLKRVDSHGQAFTVIQYDARTLPGGHGLEVKQGVPLPGQVLDELAIHRASAQDVAGDPKNVLRGKSPTTQASGIMVDILKEAAEQSHTPDIMRFYRSLKRVYTKRLVCAEALYTESRLIKITGEGEDVRVRSFKGSDLRNNTDVRLEVDSGATSTKAGQTQLLMKMAEGGWIGDLLQDPEFKREFFRRLGLGSIKGKDSVDVERAEQENTKIASGEIDDIFLSEDGPAVDPQTGEPAVNPQTGEPVMEAYVVNDDPLFKLDNHAVHYETHRRFILSKEFRTLEEKVQVVLIAHTDIHHTLMVEQQKAQMQQMAVQAAMEKGKLPEMQQPEAIEGGE